MLGSCSFQGINNNPVLTINNGKESDATVKKEVKIGDITEIRAMQGIKVILKQGKNPGTAQVATTTEAEKFLRVDSKAGTLSVYYATGENQTPKTINGPSIVTITIPTFTDADLSSGASLILSEEFNSLHEVDIDLSSGAYFEAGALACTELDIDVSSGAACRITSLDGNLDADASSGSFITINSYSGSKIGLDASSGASLTVEGINASQLKAEASSGGSITLNGKVEKAKVSTSSGGTVDQRLLTEGK